MDTWTPADDSQSSQDESTQPESDSGIRTPVNAVTVSTPCSGNSLSMSMGTPLGMEDSTVPRLQLSSSLKGLPSASKFADGIQEHINFENLPDSTGRYQSIVKILEVGKNTGITKPAETE
jgi:hypothetical protein